MKEEYNSDLICACMEFIFVMVGMKSVLGAIFFSIEKQN